MFNIFKRKGKYKMPTKEDLLALSKEEKEELLSILKSEIEVSVDVTETEKKQDEEVEEEVVVEENQLEGGKADNLTLDDIAQKHNVTVEFLNSELEKAIEVELEHTDDKEKAREIALDHLTEQADYYEKLKQVEQPTIKPEVVFQEKLDEVTKNFNEKFDALIEQFGKKLDESNKTIETLNSTIDDLKRRAPTMVAQPTLTQPNFESPSQTAREKAVKGYFGSPSSQYVNIPKK